MPLKRIPNPNSDANAWGTILNEHLAQTHRPTDGGLNSIANETQLPNNLTADDAGRSYLNVKTGLWHEWTGSTWKILGTIPNGIHYCDVVYCDPDKIPYYLTYTSYSNPNNIANAPTSFSINPPLLTGYDFIFNRKDGLLYKKEVNYTTPPTSVTAFEIPYVGFTVVNKFTGTHFRCNNIANKTWDVISPNAVVNVRDFGARGDLFYGQNYGHDDTEQIQAAMTFASTTSSPENYGAGSGFSGRACVVYFPHGLYKITNEILVRGMVVVRGDGGGSFSGSIIIQNAPNKSIFIVTSVTEVNDSSASQFQSLFFRCAVNATVDTVAAIRSQPNKVTNSIYIRDCFFQMSGANTRSIDFTRGDDIQITGCTFDVGKTAIRLGSNPATTPAPTHGNTAENVTIQNCTFFEILDWIIDVKNVKNLNIIGNRFYFGGANISINIGINTVKAENVNVLGNTIENCKTAITVGTNTKRVNIQNNVISNCTKNAIDIIGGDVLKDFMCKGNIISGNFAAVDSSNFNAGGAISAGGCGMTFSIIKDNIIQGDANGTASTIALNFPDSRTTGNNIKENLIHGFTLPNNIPPGNTL